MADRGPPQSFIYAAGESVLLQFDVDQVITGTTIRFSAKRTPTAEAALSTESAPATATATITETQQFTIAVEDEDTEDLLGTYRYSAEVEDVGGNKSEVAWGYLTFKPSLV